ncbi:MAG: alpha/beta hydrolase [Alphaproteobacteria bacterium]|nr:alpha/beta hydrolase [Alphaproteobacteria bacterium]
MTFQEKYYDSHDGLKLYYRQYGTGDQDKTPLLCLHGLTRNSRDFDRFARHFAKGRRVYSLDIRGRGQSAYDPDYGNYQIPVYAQDVLTFLTHEKLDRVIPVGTSMGGLISMTIGAIKPDVLAGIILNDIGPDIDPKGIERISAFVGNGITLDSWQQAINGVKVINGSMFPDYDAEDWDRFARSTFREKQDGTIAPDYDQAIGTAIRESAENAVPVDLWPLFTSLAPIPILTLRGENSDILAAETLDRMGREHPRFTALTVPNRAHTPDLTEDISLRAINDFISAL